ncbi:MAG: GAF domain-containing protein, partial [Candidatus Eremiobacteraeota bacterium]|nr:GAF domain-containing protein [Candidatus Eremiobacteraeota bacterium]
VSLRQGRGGEMVVRKARGVEAEQMALLTGGSLLAEVEGASKGVLVLDATKDKFKGVETGFRSAICVPIRSQDETIGLLCAIDQAAGTFSYSSLNRVEDYAAKLAHKLEKLDWAGDLVAARPKAAVGLTRRLMAPALLAALAILYGAFYQPRPPVRHVKQAGPNVRVRGRLTNEEGSPISASAIEAGRFVLTSSQKKVAVERTDISTGGDGDFLLSARLAGGSKLEFFVQVPGHEPVTTNLNCNGQEADVGQVTLPRRLRGLPPRSPGASKEPPR